MLYIVSNCFLMLTTIEIHAVNSQTFSWCNRLTMNENFNMIYLNVVFYNKRLLSICLSRNKTKNKEYNANKKIYHFIKHFGEVDRKVKTECVHQSIDTWSSCLGFTILKVPNMFILKNFVYGTNNINYWGKICSFFIISYYKSQLFIQNE